MCAYTYIRFHTYIHVHTPTHVHIRQHIYRYAVWFGREHTRRTEIRADLIFNLFPSIWKMENAIRGLRGPRFSRHAAKSVHAKKKDYCATIGVTFPPHTLFQNSRGRSDQRISLREMHEFKNMNLINCLIDCIIFYRYKSDAPRAARIFTLWS